MGRARVKWNFPIRRWCFWSYIQRSSRSSHPSSGNQTPMMMMILSMRQLCECQRTASTFLNKWCERKKTTQWLFTAARNLHKLKPFQLEATKLCNHTTNIPKHMFGCLYWRQRALIALSDAYVESIRSQSTKAAKIVTDFESKYAFKCDQYKVCPGTAHAHTHICEGLFSVVCYW